MSDRLALVTGGTGAVGREVVRSLVAADVRTVFTFHENRELASELAREESSRAEALDLRDPAAVRGLVARIEDEDGRTPDLFVHAAAITGGTASIEELTDEAWREVHEVNAHSALVAAQALAPGMAKAGGGDVVLVGALDRAQSLPLPVAFAASQGMLSAMTMALAKELGPQGIRVNVVSLGLLEGGLSDGLDKSLREDYLRFSALRRAGTPAEAARVITWLALENSYVNGRVVAVNGGI